MKVLRISHGPVRRGGRQILEAGRIEVPVPAVMGVVGINGSGKTSLFMALSGGLLRQGAAARVCIDGVAATIALVSQPPALPGWLLAAEVAALYGSDFRELRRSMPGLYLGELEGQRMAALSAGQRQAVALAVALGTGAQVMLLDEPFSALDFRRRLGALELLRRWRATQPGRALLVSSQSAADLTAACDHFVVLRDGRYAFSGAHTRLAARGGQRQLERQLLRLLT
jgi:ABC-type multidrug transport system ATPase subunit